tara:strand:- start:229 stop:417 length:189 start_codon:yes stop_codon:yes gene_type:complete
MLFLFLLLISLIAYVAAPVYIDSFESALIKTFFKKDEERLNKVRVHTSNIYANNERQYEKFF